MGAPKALLAFPNGSNAETFVSRSIRILAEGGIDEIVVVVNSETEAAIREVISASAKIAVNSSPELGMVSSIRVALGALGEPAPERIVVTLVDIPEIRSDVVAGLRTCAAGDGWIVFPRYEDGRGHPLAVLRAAFSELERPLPMGLKTICNEHPERIREIGAAGRQPWDVDTPADYARYRS